MENEFHLMNDVETADRKYYVSTAKINTHYPVPIPIYETMIFRYKSKNKIDWEKDVYNEHCSNEETAKERHNYIINHINEFIERK